MHYNKQNAKRFWEETARFNVRFLQNIDQATTIGGYSISHTWPYVITPSENRGDVHYMVWCRIFLNENNNNTTTKEQFNDQTMLIFQTLIKEVCQNGAGYLRKVSSNCEKIESFQVDSSRVLPSLSIRLPPQRPPSPVDHFTIARQCIITSVYSKYIMENCNNVDPLVSNFYYFCIFCKKSWISWNFNVIFCNYRWVLTQFWMKI